ncbi:MAG: 3-methyl-2-oxobutanoate hydroxymethyltransferase [Kiritimatiellia bacterium]|nr:3-methyl-2-oxobutanoate hydroxymethyltransferase [Kiritimatiellia bacterium]
MSTRHTLDSATVWTAPKVRNAKGKTKLVCVTAYDAAFARLLDEAGIPLLLVGDSVGMTQLGFDSTLPVTMEHMVHHTSAVTRAVRRSLVVADMPFLSYQISEDQAVANAGRLIQEGGAGAVKLEGGVCRAGLVRRLIEIGIPVMGHVGLQPQQIRTMGGYRVQGKNAESIARIVEDARALDEAGAFAIVLEGMPPEAAREVSAAVRAPTIGIGAGPFCDGQVLVLHDLLGLTEKPPRFVRPYADFRNLALDAFRSFQADVEAGRFPGPEQGYSS